MVVQAEKEVQYQLIRCGRTCGKIDIVMTAEQTYQYHMNRRLVQYEQMRYYRRKWFRGMPDNRFGKKKQRAKYIGILLKFEKYMKDKGNTVLQIFGAIWSFCILIP